MSPTTRRQLRQEVDLIGRFAESYRRKFSELIDRLNHSPTTHSTDLASLRLCVEAVDMMLSNQTELARVLRDLTEQPRDTRVVTLRSAA
jgi:hypothetical protein